MLVLNLIIGLSIPGIDWRAHLGGLVAGVVAGLAVDPSRPAGLRRVATLAGFALLLAAAVAMVLLRIPGLEEELGIAA
jgi:hypothetical protein